MSVFSRFQDIVSSNINAMLDNTEDPEKMIRLMISEMEGTLIDIKRSCAQVMANVITVKRQQKDAFSRQEAWEGKAELAVAGDRDDLAREALLEKRRYSRVAEGLGRELAGLNDVVSGYKSDILKLEDKLAAAREKRRALIHRHIHARRRKCVEERIRCIDSAESILKFEQLRSRIDRMESEAELVNHGCRPSTQSRFDSLLASAEDDAVEAELRHLKAPHYRNNDNRPMA